MEPYYDHDGITIYHGDCADVIPLVPPDTVGLLLTDPPYGIDYQSSPRWNGRGIVGDAAAFDPAPLLAYGRCVIFGADNFTDKLPISRGWIIWDKRDQTNEKLPGSDVELAWSNVSESARLFRKVWMPHTIRGEALMHPTQKPTALMRWIVEKWTDPGDLVFDPYMGSGPVARACADLGRRYIGVEIVEEYCAAAAARLGQLSLQL
jgi:site-specific DNA-methyltransferase (adenine-specific)